MKTIFALLPLTAFTLHAADESARLLKSYRFTDAKTKVSAAAVELAVPAGAFWRLGTGDRQGPLTELTLSTRYEPSDSPVTKPDIVTVTGLVQGEAKPFTLRLESVPPGRVCVVEWDPGKGEMNADVLKRWASSRAAYWASLSTPPGSLTDRLGRMSASVYGGDAQEWIPFERNREEAEPMDTLAIFGGRCAVTETLQLRDIDQPGNDRTGAKQYTQSVPVKELPRVEVKSHPFSELVKQRAAAPGPAPLDLAAFCPPDRFFAYLQQPRRLRTVVEQIGHAADQLSSPSLDGATDYRLWQKYLDRLGLKEEMVRAWLEGGHAERVAITLPDLFIRDGTDITFLIRMKDGNAPLLFSAMPETAAVLSIPGGGGGQCHIARRGQVLIASTSRAEAELAVKLADAKGAGSLGASDELLCMRQRLPDSASTVAWCYFSDAFIRRITGPEVKIGQHRRMVAREKMESLTAAALLYQLDHGAAATGRDQLVETGYAAGFKPGENRWSPRIRMDQKESSARFKDIKLTGFTASSDTWGTLAALQPLSAQPVVSATAEEATMYAAYVTRYQDYWRRYFDPIAIRLDETAPGTWSLSTLVLPLVDNSLYSGLKEALDPKLPAAMPVLDPPPVATLAFSLNSSTLKSNTVRSLLHSGLAPAEAYTGRIAFALPDADPILQAGGFAGIQQLGGVVDGRSEMGGIGLLLSLLTRPLDIFLEVKDEGKAQLFLDAFIYSDSSRWMKVRRVQREGERRAIYAIDFDGLVQLHIAASIENGWLHLSNHPWSSTVKVTGTAPAARGPAYIRLNPAALRAGNAGAVFQAQNQRRARVIAAAAELQPWMKALGCDSTKAQELQYAALGLSTPLPAGVTVSATDPLQLPGILTDKGETLTAADAATDPGILSGIQSVELFTAMEEDGLRADLEWKFAPQ